MMRRRKPGPQLGPDGKRVTRTIALTVRQDETLEDLAMRRGLSVSKLVATWIEIARAHEYRATQ